MKTEFKTETIKLKLGRGKTAINIHLIIGHSMRSKKELNYLSAEAFDDRYIWIRHLMWAYCLGINCGLSLTTVTKHLKYHQDGPLRVTNSPYVPNAASVQDMIGLYLENRFLKIPIIKRFLADGIEPARALDKDGRRYIDWHIEALQEKLQKHLTTSPRNAKL